MKKLLARLLILFYFSASCASYTAQPVTLLRIQAAAASAEQEGFAVGVTPHLSAERNTQIFGADLKQAGILPLQVVVRNNTQERLKVRKGDFVLRLSSNNEYAPAPPSVVAARLESYLGVIGWTVAFGLVGFFASSAQQQEVNNARRADLRSKEFADVSLDSQDSAQGFLFFLIPDEVKEIKEAALSARALEPSGGKKINVALRLGDMDTWNERKVHPEN
ncbi:MAG TPA: hypothetical protein VE616_07340 [Candidatus Udaeobacter sp.]|nr:hypothetical protein [Candidatus Udaeobacter sp.]